MKKQKYSNNNNNIKTQPYVILLELLSPTVARHTVTPFLKITQGLTSF